MGFLEASETYLPRYLAEGIFPHRFLPEGICLVNKADIPQTPSKGTFLLKEFSVHFSSTVHRVSQKEAVNPIPYLT